MDAICEAKQSIDPRPCRHCQKGKLKAAHTGAAGSRRGKVLGTCRSLALGDEWQRATAYLWLLRKGTCFWCLWWCLTHCGSSRRGGCCCHQPPSQGYGLSW